MSLLLNYFRVAPIAFPLPHAPGKYSSEAFLAQIIACVLSKLPAFLFVAAMGIAVMKRGESIATRFLSCLMLPWVSTWCGLACPTVFPAYRGQFKRLAC